jgi:EmrB/QacA subfamily drug resistance transporter
MRVPRIFVFLVLSLSMLIYAMQFTTIAVALADLNEDLDTPVSWEGWVITIFMLGQVIALPVAGRLSDRIGRRTTFIGGLAGFTAASLVCAVAPNIYVLILARAAQGFSGGALSPAAMGLIGDAWGEDRARPIGLATSLSPMGTVIGPTLGGLIVDHISWRGIFALNVPLGILGLVAAFLILPRSEKQGANAPFDTRGLVLLAVAVTALMYGITELGDPHANLLVVGGCILVSAASTILLLRQERRVEEPVIPLDLLRRKEFAYTDIVAFCYGVALFGIASYIPLYAQEAYDMSASVAGAIVTPRAVAVVAMSAIASIVITRTGYRVLILSGLLGLAAMLALLAMGLHHVRVAGIELTDFTWLSLVSAVTGVCVGSINPTLSNACLHLEPGRIPEIVGLRSMFQFLGGTIGVSFIVLVMARAETKGGGIELAFAGMAVLLLAIVPLVLRIPDLPKARRRVTAEAAPASSAVTES